MNTIFDLVNSTALAVYYQEIASNAIPYIGEALFPSEQKLGLEISWIKGYESLPIALQPSAFDVKPSVRDRIGAKEITTEMPFFRESMHITEKDRQKLLMFSEANRSPYAQEVIRKIFDDVTQLVEGAKVQPERMRFSLMTEAKIEVASDNVNGKGAAVYNYNYDPSGQWAANNKTPFVKTGTSRWSDTENSNPIADIEAAKSAASKKGIVLRRMIISDIVLDYLMANKKIRLDMNPVGGLNLILTKDDILRYLSRKVTMQIIVYDKMFKDERLREKRFLAEQYVILLPEGPIGKTFYGTTPEQADLMGKSDVDVSVVNVGVAIATYKEKTPVNVITIVSEIVLPSFEGMDSVYVITALGAE